MAPIPPGISWTDESRLIFERLPFDIRKQIGFKLEVVRQHPRMYQLQDVGRWRGLRRFIVNNWKVYYIYWNETHTIYVEAVRHVRAGEAE